MIKFQFYIKNNGWATGVSEDEQNYVTTYS